MNINFFNLKRRVMTRIYLEYGKNMVLDYPDYFMLFLFLIASFILISIDDVLTNMPKNDLGDALNFFLMALRNTSLIIQVLIVGFFARVIFSGAKITYKSLGPRISALRFRY